MRCYAPPAHWKNKLQNNISSYTLVPAVAKRQRNRSQTHLQLDRLSSLNHTCGMPANRCIHDRSNTLQCAAIVYMWMWILRVCSTINVQRTVGKLYVVRAHVWRVYCVSSSLYMEICLSTSSSRRVRRLHAYASSFQWWMSASMNIDSVIDNSVGQKILIFDDFFSVLFFCRDCFGSFQSLVYVSMGMDWPMYPNVDVDIWVSETYLNVSEWTKFLREPSILFKFFIFVFQIDTIGVNTSTTTWTRA